MKKRICFFSGDITRSGGTERVSVQLANALNRDGMYDICFVSLTEQEDKPFYPLDPEIRRYRLGDKWINPGLKYIPLIGKLRRFIKSQKIDIIIDIDIVLDVLSIPATAGLAAKVISWEHFNCEYEQSVTYRRLISKLTARFADYVITLTEEDKENYERILGRKANISAIYNIPTKMQRHDGVPRENIIVTAGRLTYQKGTEYLAAVAAAVLKKHGDWRWLVLGDGEERNILERAIAENSLEHQLILKGTVDSVESYLERAKLFVLASRYEGFGMCLVEALQMKVPCVSFDVKVGPSEIISNGHNGVLIPPFDCEKMADEIFRLIENPGILDEMSANTMIGFERFEEEQILTNWKSVLNALS